MKHTLVKSHHKRLLNCYNCYQSFRLPVSRDQLARRAHRSPWDPDSNHQEVELLLYTENREESSRNQACT